MEQEVPDIEECKGNGSKCRMAIQGEKKERKKESEKERKKEREKWTTPARSARGEITTAVF
jgi:hypothetical protein